MVVRFAPKRARDVPLFVAGLPIFSRAYYRRASSTRRRSRCRSAPAPTRSAASRPGRYIEFERVKDWWGADLPIVARAVQFRRRALRVLPRPRRRLRRLHRQELPVPRGIHLAHLGDALRLSRRSATAASSATILPDETPSGAQGWFINTRREKFKDAGAARGADLRLRLRVDQQEHHVRLVRAHPFGVPELRHDGGGQAGAGEELALLEPFRGKVPDEVFGEPFVPPVSDGSGQDRALLRKAAQLLQRGRLSRSRTASASTPRASARRSSS